MKDNKKILYPVYDYGELNVTISKQNKKLGNIPAFNTLAGNRLLTLSNGTILTNIVGTCGKHCKECFHDCYAVRYIKCHHNSTVRPYAANTIVMRHDPDKLRKAIKEYCDKNIVKYFRFHTSGELESLQQFFSYCKICLENPDVIFYIYTKAFDILEKYLDLGEEFPNTLSSTCPNGTETPKDYRKESCQGATSSHTTMERASSRQSKSTAQRSTRKVTRQASLAPSAADV